MQASATDFVLYTVSDVGEAAEFYRETLGLTQESIDAELGWAEFVLPPTTLALGEDSTVPVSPGEGGAGVALAVDDVAAAVAELEGEGHAVHMDAVDTGVCSMAMVADPDGNPIMLHRRDDGTAGRRDPIPE